MAVMTPVSPPLYQARHAHAGHVTCGAPARDCAMLLVRALRALHRRHACRFPARVSCTPQCPAPLLPALAHRPFYSAIPCYKAKKPREDGGSSSSSPQETDEEDEDDDIEDLLVPPTPAPHGIQNIFLVHPDVKWGPKKQFSTTADLQVAEAVSLVQSLPNWTVVDKLIMSTKSPDSKHIFGKGNFQVLTEKIKRMSPLTAVFLNVERVSALTEKELEEAWGVKIYDRYTVVLNVFRYNACTREAKLQIALAELPLLRSKLRNEMAHLDQQGGGSRYIMGSGETLMEVQQRIIKEREIKIKKALEKLRKKRKILRTQRKRQEFPVISVMGYTNCGKTTLVKALTGDANLHPRDQLFATLDVTAHGGLLPCRMPVIFVDTIGFLSQLPHNLIESFSATLEDVVHSDLLIHVKDISHPEAANQKASVMSALANLNVPQKLIDTMIEVHNKIDLVEKHEPFEEALPVSALLGHGMDDLKQQIEKAVMKNTGRTNMTIRVNLESPQLSWLYKEASVQQVTVLPDDGTADVQVIITNAAYGKYRKLFCN